MGHVDTPAAVAVGAQSSRFESNRGVSRIRVPSDTVLTVRALVGAGRKLADAELAKLVEGLIDEMDARTEDPDREPEDWT